MNYGIVPAAGRSSRLGRGKALLPLGGSVVLDRLIGALRRGGTDRIVVISAEGDEALRERSAGLGLDTAVNARPERGMLSSIHCGLRELAGEAEDSDVLVICPVDYPAIAELTIRQLISGISAGGHSVAVPTREGRRGHPIAVKGSLSTAVFALDLDRGLRQLLERYPPLAVEVEDPAIHQDLDTWLDYSALIDGVKRL